MSRKALLTIVIVVAVAAGLLLIAQEDGSGSRVFVTNFPETQIVEGSVTVNGPFSHARLASVRDVVVTPVARGQTTRLADGGVIETAGFTHAVFSIAGDVKGEHFRAGRVGAVLLPDEERVEKALVEKQVFLFPIDVVARAEPENQGLFSSNPVRVPVAFPRYRVYFYNATDRTTNVTFFAYLTN
jgi:hypothetical protein